jgi:1-acyl-sn-glycerol-3-phosphate acyltransferase
MWFVFSRVDVKGRENVPPYGPLIIAANHQSYADPPLMMRSFRRPIWFMAKRSLFRVPVVSYLLRCFHTYPVGRDSKDIAAISWALAMLQTDKAVLVFPEGTRSPRSLRKAANGLVYLALRSQAPIIPVAITGTEHLSGILRVLFPFRRLTVTIGQAFTLPLIEGTLEREQLEGLTTIVMERIALLLPVQYRGAYASSPSSSSQ